MTATVIGISPAGRDGSRSLDAREYRVIYKVRTDDRLDGPNKANDAFGIPNLGDSYVAGNDVDSVAVVIDKQATQGESPWHWDVEVTYSTDLPDNDAAAVTENVDNPLLEPPEIRWSSAPRMILVPGKYNDPLGPPTDKGWEAGIFAPNGELFEPQPEAEIFEPVLNIRRNIATFDNEEWMDLGNSVNSTDWNGAKARQLRLIPPEAERKFHKGIGFYWIVNYLILFRFETWDIQTLNQGHFYWSGGKPASVWSTTTLPRVKKFLSGEVRLINLTTSGDINTTSTPTFTRTRFYREKDFNTLGLL